MPLTLQSAPLDSKSYLWYLSQKGLCWRNSKLQSNTPIVTTKCDAYLMQITENPLHHCQIGLVLLVFLLCLTRRLTYRRTAFARRRGYSQSIVVPWLSAAAPVALGARGKLAATSLRTTCSLLWRQMPLVTYHCFLPTMVWIFLSGWEKGFIDFLWK